MLNRSRRRFLAASAAGALIGPARVCRALPTIDSLKPVEEKITGGADLREGRVTVDVPHLSDNGHSVPLKITVTSAMSEREYVRAIHVLSEKNPRPIIAVFHL